MKRLKPILIIILVLVLVFSLGSAFKKLIYKLVDEIYGAVEEPAFTYEQESEIPQFSRDYASFTMVEWGGSEIS